MNNSLLRYLQKTKWISRRDFFEMIKEKAISLNNNIVEDINQEIEVWDKIIIKLNENEFYEETIKKLLNFKPIMIAFNKPKWYVVSKSDKHNKTIYELLPKSWLKDFYYIWRLDKESQWLLLLTNSPEIVDFYENPKNKIIKIYEVKIDKMLKTNHIIKFKKWINVDQDWNLDTNWELLSFHDVKSIMDNKWDRRPTLRILLKEWKNRHIRRALKALWYKTIDLKRIKVWKYELWSIKLWKYLIHKKV